MGVTLVLTSIPHGVLAQTLSVPICNSVNHRPTCKGALTDQEHKWFWDTVSPVSSMSDRGPSSLIGSCSR
jgi:hypothetical protein